MKNIKELAYFLIEQNTCPMTCLPDVTTDLELYLTLSVTTAERSFSKL